MTTSKGIRSDLRDSAASAVAEYRKLKEVGFINRPGVFFPAGVHYPPITRYPPISQEAMFAGYQPPADGRFDVYIHIPFCMQRCAFCHYPLKLGSNQEQEKDLYLQHLAREMDIYMAVLGVQRIKVRSILVGGGTPTYLTPTQMKTFFRDVGARFDLSKCTQFSYDVDPVTLLGEEGAERLSIMRDHGVDRLTIGVQSLDDAMLDRMNRPHDAKQVLDVIEATRKRGFQLNIEFIFGYPGQTLEGWTEDIERAIALDVDEIQMYRLKVDAYGDYQGPVKSIIERNSFAVPTDEDDISMKRVAIDLLTAQGFTEPIRRVFSRKKSLYSHYAWNQCCLLEDELGIGLTAFSSLRDRFVLNTQYFDEYYGSISSGRLPINRGLVRGPEEQKRWAFILPLKNSFIRKKLYEQRTGVPLDTVFRDKVERLKSYGLLVEDEQGLHSTPLGAFYADELSHQFYAPEFLPNAPGEYDGPLSPHAGGDGHAQPAAALARSVGE